MVVDTQGALQKTSRIVVVDDFVTRGATFIGSCSRIAEVFPGADITAFAAVRTMTGAEVDALVQPATGEIRLLINGETFRTP
jgi:adenine/guanine phosphoribosyltransferase-like PRPP-binding protein